MRGKRFINSEEDVGAKKCHISAERKLILTFVFVHKKNKMHEQHFNSVEEA